MKSKWFASVLSERIGFKRLHWRNIFLSHDTRFSRWFSCARKL